MTSLFLAPHSDDESLFGFLTMLRKKPEVYVVTDGVRHEKKFKFPTERRRGESISACAIAGVSPKFLGVSDEESTTEEDFRIAILPLLTREWDMIFAPMEVGGHIQHDWVSRIAGELWGDKVLYYGIYSKESMTPFGEMILRPNEEEFKLKSRALEQYQTQRGINLPHFTASLGAPEFLSFNAKEKK